MEGKKHLILFFVVALICFGMAVMCCFSKLHGFHLFFLCVCFTIGSLRRHRDSRLKSMKAAWFIRGGTAVT